MALPLSPPQPSYPCTNGPPGRIAVASILQPQQPHRCCPPLLLVALHRTPLSPTAPHARAGLRCRRPRFHERWPPPPRPRLLERRRPQPQPRLHETQPPPLPWPRLRESRPPPPRPHLRERRRPQLPATPPSTLSGRIQRRRRRIRHLYAGRSRRRRVLAEDDAPPHRHRHHHLPPAAILHCRLRIAASPRRIRFQGRRIRRAPAVAGRRSPPPSRGAPSSRAEDELCRFSWPRRRLPG
ncbi:hypothetical protein OsI_26473 [Oryza sativa Indica Group]|uniref:Uncharacterized protein n=1 Tax=Oryza sativa subsp. indica TaxID=39946 RepID=B8B7G0_ORYSI|nr:hypothetical protein OsI_26473 [Oryza sativa Indica Group]